MDLPSHLCCLAINAEQCGTAIGQIRYHLYALADGSFRMNYPHNLARKGHCVLVGNVCVHPVSGEQTILKDRKIFQLGWRVE